MTKDNQKQKKKTIPLIDKDRLKSHILKNPQYYTLKLSLACTIASAALHSKHDWSGRDMVYHYLHVGVKNNEDEEQIIVGILHDLIEDSDWTAQDLRDVGFDEHIIHAIKSVTKEKNQPYFEKVKQIAQNSISNIFTTLSHDGITKLNDNDHNMDLSRNEHHIGRKQIYNGRKYMISKEFLLATQKGIINKIENRWIKGPSKLINIAGAILEKVAHFLNNKQTAITVSDFVLDYRPDLFDIEILEKEDPEGFEKNKQRILEFQANAQKITQKVKQEAKHQQIPKEQIISMLENANDTGRDNCLNTALFIASQSLRSDLHDPALRYLSIAYKFKDSNYLMATSILYDVLKNTDWEIDDLRKIFKNKPRIIKALERAHPKETCININTIKDWKNPIDSDEHKIVTAYLQYMLNFYNWRRMPEYSEIEAINFYIDINHFLRFSGDKNSYNIENMMNYCDNETPIPQIKPF